VHIETNDIFPFNSAEEIARELGLKAFPFDRETQYEDWIKARKDCIGSSMIPNILSLNSYTSRKKEVEKMALGVNTFVDTPYTQAGKLIEPIIQQLYNEQSKFGRIFPSQTTYVWKENEKYLSTPDGFVCNVDGDIAVNEAKFTGRKDDLETWAKGEVPKWAQVQCQWHMGVCGVPVCLFTPMIQGNPLIKKNSTEIQFDEDLFRELVAAANQFIKDVKKYRKENNVS
jgi:predicted phage-related endonuclease